MDSQDRDFKAGATCCALFFVLTDLLFSSIDQNGEHYKSPIFGLNLSVFCLEASFSLWAFDQPLTTN